MYFCIVVISGVEFTGPGTVLSVQVRTGGRGFRVKQMGYLEAAENESVILPCFFTYPDTFTPRYIRITWIVGAHFGTKIFNSSQNNAFGEYRGRIEFLGSPLRDKTGSIRLHRLKGNDSNFYVCRVTSFNARDEPIVWQSISGTFLSVRATQKMQILSHGSILMIRSALVLGLLAVVWTVGIYLIKGNPVTDAYTRRVKKETVQENQL
ncbi:paired immunoglobulin-like type 2 receptor alpha [Hemitrygon akajei]|uniref:paired immunoglobulin-like type 2 receptor alpha n=1 Tax=Hemitrygon akajei TaxID=2704970 RepID=UPI003BF9CE9B